MQKIIITIVLTLAFLVGNAQTTPESPTPPSTNSSSNYNSSTKSRTNNESTSISISHTDDDYKLRARFPKNRYEKLKDLIEKTLGGKNMDIGKGYSKWSSDEKVYSIKLTEKNLRITLDLNVASPALTEKFENLGEDIKIIVSGSSVKVEQERVQREADRMRRKADRLQLEAKRLERQAVAKTRRFEAEKEREKRQVERKQRRIELDAKRIEKEAKRIERQAKEIEKKARHKGGVGSHIKRLLNDSKTVYTATSGSNFNWIWPEVQENLLASLLKDQLITTTSEVTFTSEKDRMYVNGTVLEGAQYEKYSAMFRKAGIQTNADFSFYKKGNHIVIIGLNARIEKVFNDLHKKGFITSTDEAVKLLIDGNNITQNGTRLANDKVAAYNAILRDNGIIPAPGKYIEMKKAGSYRLGYSLGKNGIVGTWIEED
ncbi:MAG: cell envelope integrity protein TolA [Kordia sp.]|uniref:cell envelope integrity protein TolA n=1 Tax=Kordia sp. TaxID=1965332 RepID=UPI00385DA97A